MGLISSSTIGRIRIDPNDPDKVWVAASGNLFVPGGQRGVYLSTDAGKTWKLEFKPPNKTTGAVDITIDPSDSDHVIASLWDHRRKPDIRRYTGIGSGIWETTNGGKSWQRLGTDEGLPAPSEDTGRIGVSFAPSDASRVYAIYANNASGSFQNFFTSTTGGKSWKQAAGAGSLGGSQSTYGWWFARIFVDPADADDLFVPGVSMYRSTNGADTFSACCGGLHADQHIVVWDTHQGGDLYAGNDGGLYASSNGGSSFTKSSDEPWSQYVSFDVSAQDPTRTLGGLQDNGTRASWLGYQDIIGGDGQKSLINPKDKDTYYGCYQYGNCTGFSGGNQFNMPFQSDRFPFLMQMELQPGHQQFIYGGGNELNVSSDGGHTFKVITGDLGHGDTGSGGYPFGTISAIGLAGAYDAKVIWVGTDNGYVYKSTDKGAHFDQLPAPIKPRRWVSRITIDPNKGAADNVFITFSGYRAGDNSPYVLHSTDGGKTWTDISANLPKAPVNDIVLVGSQLYVATDVGVFTSPVNNPNWKSVGHGMPQLIVTDLRYIDKNHSLYAATFGMGVWSVKI
jgi:photosystem II stability/assembly factor-like uncharacterized protein